MSTTSDTLRGELERLFELDEMKRLSTDLLGLDPDEVGGTSGKAAFARALVDRCATDDGLEALADAILLQKGREADKRVRDVAAGRLWEELQPGTDVSGFRVMKKIGEGGIGVVYYAERKHEEESGNGAAVVRAAVKVVRPAWSRDRSAVRRWLTLARALGRVGSPGLAAIEAVGQLPDGRPWIATRYVEGQTLAARVQRIGPIHFNEARPVMRGVLEALESLHKAGIVHGDVKAENVFVVRRTGDESGKTEPTGVLVDAGTDRLLFRAGIDVVRTGPLPLFGTPKALAPEVARGGELTPSSDLYACGCMLYEILTGKPPFTGETAIDVVAQHLVSQPQEPSVAGPKGWVPKEIDAVILKALAKDPAQRYRSARELLEALETVGRAVKERSTARADLDTKALEHAVDALKQSPADEERAAEIERVVGPAHAWAKAVEVFREIVAATEDKEAKKALLFRVARIEEAELEDKSAAGATYAQILEIDPEDEMAQIALEELKRASGDAEGLVELLLTKVEKESSASERAAILKEIAQLYEEKLDAADSAFVAWVQALAEDPRDERIAREIERLATSTDRWNEALTTLSEATQGGDLEPARKAHLFAQMGRWYAERLQRPDFALGCYGQALQLDPTDDRAYDGVADLYRKTQSWQELVTALLQRAETCGNPARARDHRTEAADVVLRKMGDSKRAMGMFQEVLEADPAHPKAAEALESIYAERSEWKPLVKLLEERAKNERGERKVETLNHIAEIYEDRLSDDEEALKQYEAALAVDERNIPALKGLERLYAKSGRYRELLLNLERQLELMATPRQKIVALERIGGLQEEEFVDHEKAALAFEQIVAIEPGHEAANTALARVYRTLHRFDDLVATLDRHAKASEDPKRKVDLLLTAVRTLMVDVGAPERAMQFCERVLAVDPMHSETLELVARLKASTGDAVAAVEAMDRLAENEKDPQKKADLWVKAGKMLETSGDKDRAIDRYKLALDARPNDPAATQALRAVYASRGDAHGAAELLQREIEVTDGPIKKAALYAELGEIHRARLDDKIKARECFKKALELDPTCTPATQGLGDMAFDEGDVKEAVKHYEPLLARTSTMPPATAKDVSIRTGEAFQKAGLYDKAQRAYLNAKAFAPDDRDVLERVAEVTFDAGLADEAVELYRDFLQKFRKDLQGRDKGRILWRLGESLRRASHFEDAIPYLNEAAELLLDDPKPLDSLRRLYEQQGKWEQAVRTMRRRMEVAGDEERFDLLVAIGDVLLEKMGDRAKASKSYVAALEIRADDRNLLTKLMGVYSESKDWSRLVEVILRIAELVEDKRQLGKYYLTAASIAHEELGRLDEASEYYQTALDNDPSLERAFQGLVRCLGQKQDWDALADAYRDHLKRIEASWPPEQRAKLWDALGEVLLHRLDARGEAIEALEQAQQLEQSDRRRTEQLAELYGSEPKRYAQKAAHAHRALLAMSPYRIESYQALRRLYTELKRPDEAWCACQTLRALGMADPDEEAFFKKHRAKTPAAAQEFLTEELWFNHLIHPEQDPLLTGIFAIITPAVAGVRSQALSQFGVDASQKRNAETDPAQMAQMLHYAAAVSQIKLPDVYYRDNDPGGLSVMFSNPPAIGIGKGALGGGPAQALAFVAARHLSYFRPGHYLRHLVPTGSGLRQWLLAAIKTATPHFPIPADMQGTIDQHRKAFEKHIGGPEHDKLGSLVQKLLAAAPELDMKKWVAAVDLTADRLGFVLANDLEIAAAVVKASPEDAAGVNQKDRLKELYLYSVSDEYVQLRHKLGIAIGD